MNRTTLLSLHRAARTLPTLTRLRATPLRDLLRGLHTARLDPALVARAAGLPDALVQIVAEVTRGTRLWKLERSEVAYELSSHFAEGLASGRSADELARAFGSPALAARLIRRAKKRARPWPWHAARRAVQGAGLLVVVMVITYVAVAIPFYLRRPRPSVDYVARMNEPARGVPEGERAWPIYLDALEAMLPLTTERVPRSWPSSRPGWHDWEESLAYHAKATPALDLVRRASTRPHLGLVVANTIADDRFADIMDQRIARRAGPGAGTLPTNRAPSWPNDEPWMIGVLLPHLSEFRAFARHLAFDMRLAAKEGDAERFLADARAMLALGRHAAQPPVLISQLVRTAIFGLHHAVVGETLADHPGLLDEKQLTELIHLVATIHDDELRPDFALERQTCLDTVQRVFSDNGRGGGRLTLSGLRELNELRGDPPSDFGESTPVTLATGPVLSVLFTDRRTTVEWFDRAFDHAEALAATPMWAWPPDAMEHEPQEMRDEVWRWRNPLPSVLLPGLSSAAASGQRAAQERDALLVVLALTLHKARHGAYPASLDALQPGLLPTIPPDRFDGRPIRYRLTSDGPVVYSIGSDRDDDNGTPNPDSAPMTAWQRHGGAPWPRSGPSVPPSGDWILWPPADPVEPEPYEETGP